MANTSISRRQLLRGDPSGARMPIRPPWAVPETTFTASCDRCGDCVSVCAEGVIQLGDGGFPTLDFSAAGCSFCADCVTVCDGKALKGNSELDAPWTLTARIADSCLAFRGVICRSCAEACDEGALAFGLRVGGAAEPILSTDRCTGCGFCVRVCPVQAVRIETLARPDGAAAERELRAS